MTSKELAVNVTVGSQTYEAGTVPPKEVSDLITNPKAYGDEPDAEGKASAKRSTSSKTQK